MYFELIFQYQKFWNKSEMQEQNLGCPHIEQFHVTQFAKIQ